MNDLYPVEFPVKERVFIVGTLRNKTYALWEEEESAEAEEYNAILDDLWEHTSHPTNEIPDGVMVSVALTGDQWSLIGRLLDVEAFQRAPRHPEEAALGLRVRDRIHDALGDALPATTQPSAPQRRQTSVPIGELGCYWLYPGTDPGYQIPVLGQMNYDDWLDKGNGLVVRSHILTGTRNGTITLTAELLNGPPPPDTGLWDDIAEYSSDYQTARSFGGQEMAYTLLAKAPEHQAVSLVGFDPLWPSWSMYRVRVSVRGRDAAVSEQHLIQLWQAPSAPEQMIKTTDLTGQRRRAHET